MLNSFSKQKNLLSFVDVLQFAAGYWFRQPKKLTLILLIVLVAALLETYLPTALSAFLGTIREHADKYYILYSLEIFIAVYLAQSLFFALAYIIYNSFETHIFKSLVDDTFTAFLNSFL